MSKRNYYTLNEARYVEGCYFNAYHDDELIHRGYRFNRLGAHIGARLQIFLHKVHLSMYYIEKRRKAREQARLERLTVNSGRIYVR